MNVDIDNLSEAELIDLNHRIIERLRFMGQMRAHMSMLEFRIGDRVVFQSDRMEAVSGVLTRYNRKTVTVISDDGRRWNVSPGLLRKMNSERSQENANNVISIPPTR